VVDNYCAEAKLAVEIDGATHGTAEEIRKDKARQEFLEEQGLLVKRYLNVDVKENLDLVLEDILKTCRERTHPHPDPLP
jgi:very-short-patch-repair endonuclease